MNAAMNLFRNLSGVGIVPTAVLVYGEEIPRPVVGVREAGADVVIDLEDGRSVVMTERQIWAGVFDTPTTIIARGHIDGRERRVMLLGIPARPFSARARAAMATAH